ncbi:dorsal-ventral patterning protein Sog isoform X2 [Contarinia nasturtii]|uniref:dorsal-ventral patterning protein Sog isoform X2 n=1 Tax=Contarinia nasturtii TaxID=265458 RepID=UPI0012D49670|nr:dorsal-ventral patterning protein Sog isoform X2 [Contarinia nasturtii]
MIVPTSRIGTFFNVAQFIVINLVIILICLGNMPTEARKQMPLLIDDDTQTRMNRPECLFGKTLRELGSKWYADLGPPFGVMYCIECSCIPVTKRRRIVARVQCRNIKNECPKLDCDEPLQLPGKCCKVCPGKANEQQELAQDVPVLQTQEEEEKNMKHFGALLTTRTSYFLNREEIKTPYVTNNPLNIIATGRFTFHKKNLYFSFYVSERASRPRAIQFIDETGHILEEIILVQSSNIFSVYQNATGKVCGVWRRVPREYRRQLRDEEMNVVLLWGSKLHAELALAGKISKYPALSSELFTSLLEAPSDKGVVLKELNGAGGTAVVSTSSGATSSIHLTLVLNGLFLNESADVPLNVRLEIADKKQKVLQDTVVVKKSNYDYNVIEFSSPVTTQDLRSLTRGKLNLIVESRRRPEIHIQGSILTRATCEIYQTVLAPTTTESKTTTSGLAWAYMNRDGALVYNIYTDDLKLQESPLITLVDDSVKRKTDLEDLTPSLSFNNAIGVLDRMGPRVLEPLYANNLAINIATENEQNLIRGRLIGRQLADARDSEEPIILKRLDSNAPAHLVGMAWVAVDNECTLHYEITLNSYNAQQGLELYLEEKPLEAINAPVTTKILEEFKGEYLEGFVMGMSAYELSKLETSVCYLQVKAKESGTHLLKGKLRSVKIPIQCTMPGIDTNRVGDLGPNDHTDNNVPTDPKCYHSGRFYDEGEQWQNGLETCSMCACIYGRVKCDKLECPPLDCKEGELRPPRKGECCPSCSPKEMDINSNVTRGCRLGDQFHAAGSSWYPYLPPNGFDRCATCTCNPITLEVKCPRVQCPPLACSDKIAYRPNKSACCRKCPEVKEAPVEKKAHDPELMGDQGTKKGTIKSVEEILSHGGCKMTNNFYENGHEWHPTIPSHGEQKCVKCRCKDSIIKCDRKRCARAACNKSAARNRLNGLTPSPLHENADDCCLSQCRSRRHQKQKQRQQRERQIDRQQQRSPGNSKS